MQAVGMFLDEQKFLCRMYTIINFLIVLYFIIFFNLLDLLKYEKKIYGTVSWPQPERISNIFSQENTELLIFELKGITHVFLFPIHFRLKSCFKTN